ncbi:MAG TPA: hypothetical protein VD913_06475, partial [bacterium]|nr:hypothetical protein [bacterium]
GMLLKLREEEYPQSPPIEVMDPADFDKQKLEPNEQFVFDMLDPYLGYLNDNLTFETANARQALQGTGISFPLTDYKFLKTLCHYAVEAGYFVFPSLNPD